MQIRDITETTTSEPPNYRRAGLGNFCEAKLARLAARTGRNADQMALQLLADSVDHDNWFHREVEKGRLAAREGRLLDHDEIASRPTRPPRHF